MVETWRCSWPSAVRVVGRCLSRVISNQHVVGSQGQCILALDVDMEAAALARSVGHPLIPWFDAHEFQEFKEDVSIGTAVKIEGAHTVDTVDDADVLCPVEGAYSLFCLTLGAVFFPGGEIRRFTVHAHGDDVEAGSIDSECVLVILKSLDSTFVW